MSKLRVLHAAIIATADRSHHRFGHRLEPGIWREEVTSHEFQAQCNEVLVAGKKGFFSKPELPSSEDYHALAEKHIDALSRWENWPVLKAYFYGLDAARELARIDNEFLSAVAQEDLLGLIAQTVLEDLEEQVDRGYLSP